MCLGMDLVRTIAVILLIINGSLALTCFNCNSEETADCGTGLSANSSLILNCSTAFSSPESEHYCVTVESKNNGTIESVIRACSDIDYGTNCSDSLAYMNLSYNGCISTCNADFCNNGLSKFNSSPLNYILVLFLIHLFKVD